MASKYDLKETIPLGSVKDVSAHEDEQIVREKSCSSGLVNVKFPSRPRRKVMIVLAVIVLAIFIVGVLVGVLVWHGTSESDSGKDQSGRHFQGKEIEEPFSTFSFSPPSMEIISTSARVFATSAHQVQVKTAVVLDAASVISTCSYCDEVSAKLSSSVENIHANTTVTGYALSSIRQLVPNTEAKWSRWGAWSVCTRTCGNGTRVRSRTCIAQNQRAVFAPIYCAGKPLQKKNCSQWSCPDCSKTCVKGTLNAACDACTCDGHVITGRVRSKSGAPISEVSISLAETPYKVLAQTNDSGFFLALNACSSAKLLFTKVGFVPVTLTATTSTPTSANAKVKLESAGSVEITIK